MTAHTRISGKGQIVIPKALRDEMDWPSGTRIEIEKVGGALTLRPVKDKGGTLAMSEFIARRPKYEGKPLSLEEMDKAVARGMATRFREEYSKDR